MEAYADQDNVFLGKINTFKKWQINTNKCPKNIQWHMIGNVQRNKVKYMASFVDLIHGVDSEKLLKEINKQAEKHQRTINCLLQLKIAQEDTKFGMTSEAAHALLDSDHFKNLKNITS